MRNITFKKCHRRSEIIALSIDFCGRNFAGGRQRATPEPDCDYAECDSSEWRASRIRRLAQRRSWENVLPLFDDHRTAVYAGIMCVGPSQACARPDRVYAALVGELRSDNHPPRASCTVVKTSPRSYIQTGST